MIHYAMALIIMNVCMTVYWVDAGKLGFAAGSALFAIFFMLAYFRITLSEGRGRL